MLYATARHRGASLVEIYQSCPIFNDRAVTNLRSASYPRVIALAHGQPIRFGPDGREAVVRDPANGQLRITADPAQAGSAQVHDAYDDDPSTAFALARLTVRKRTATGPIGVFRAVDRPAYGDQVREQCWQVTAAGAGRRLAQVVTGTDSWRAGEAA